MVAKKVCQRGQKTLANLKNGNEAISYSGDQPNRELRHFAEGNLRPYEATTDDYSVVAFNQAITSTKATAIYNIHTYWSKKPHDAVRQYILH
jgi:hypothetical protein